MNFFLDRLLAGSRRVIFRKLICLLSLCMGLHVVAAQEPAEDEKSTASDSKLATDWSTFDPAAAVAEASTAPEPVRFERLWTSKERVRLFQGLAISANGKRVLAIDQQGRCQLIDAENGNTLVRLEVEPFSVYRSALSSDGSLAAVSKTDRSVVIFDAVGKVLRTYQRAIDKKQAPAMASRLQFANDGKHVAWVEGSTFCRAAVEQDQLLETKEDSRTGIVDSKRGSISPDALMVASPPYVFVSDRGLGAGGTHTGFLRFDADSGKSWQFRLETMDPPMVLAQSQHLLAWLSWHGNVAVQGQVVEYRDQKISRNTSSLCTLTAQHSVLRRLAISSDEQWLMLAGHGQVELRRLDCFPFPVLADADFESAAQLEVAADALRLAVVDQNGFLSVLALPKPPGLPVWKLMLTIKELVRDKQFAHLDRIAELLQDDPTPFPGTSMQPKYHAFIQEMLGWRTVGDKNAPAVSVRVWRKAQPESKLAALLMARLLISEGWNARGSGFADTVSADGWRIFNQKINQAHEVMNELLDREKPPPEAFMWLFDIAKGESWTEEECLDQAERVMALSPKYITPHQCMIEKLLIRWGGEPHSGSFYASWVADKIGGAEGDAFYTRLMLRMAFYEEPQLMREALGVDFDRVFQGCEALQKSPQSRPLGLTAELRMADLTDDRARAARVAGIIHRERTPFVADVFPSRSSYEQLVQKNLFLKSPAEDGKPEEKRKLPPPNRGPLDDRL